MMGQEQSVAEQAANALRRMLLAVLVAPLMALLVAGAAVPALAANGDFTQERMS